jgi:hypothetical protein
MKTVTERQVRTAGIVTAMVPHFETTGMVGGHLVQLVHDLIRQGYTRFVASHNSDVASCVNRTLRLYGDPAVRFDYRQSRSHMQTGMKCEHGLLILIAGDEGTDSAGMRAYRAFNGRKAMLTLDDLILDRPVPISGTERKATDGRKLH